jgi:hypothetical protein
VSNEYEGMDEMCPLCMGGRGGGRGGGAWPGHVDVEPLALVVAAGAARQEVGERGGAARRGAGRVGEEM